LEGSGHGLIGILSRLFTEFSLIWVPGHEGIDGNETAYHLARTGSEYPFTGPEPACGISIGVARKAVSGWMKRDHKRHWDSTIGLKQAKGLIFGPSAKRTKDLLELNRDQLRWVVGLLTGHCHLKGHLFKMGLTDGPICERCLEDDESATHILCDCEALAILSSYQPVVFPFENDGETSR
jgi:hypothetical protein